MQSNHDVFVIGEQDDLFRPDEILRRVLHSAGIPYLEAPIGHAPRFYVGDQRTGRVGFFALQNPALRSTDVLTAPRCFDGIGIDYLSYTTDAYGQECDPEARKELRMSRTDQGEHRVDLKELRTEYVQALASSASFVARCNAEIVHEEPSRRPPHISHAEAIRCDAERRALPSIAATLDRISTIARSGGQPSEIAVLAEEASASLKTGPVHCRYEHPVACVRTPADMREAQRDGTIIQQLARLDDDRVSAGYENIREDSLGSDRPEDFGGDDPPTGVASSEEIGSVPSFSELATRAQRGHGQTSHDLDR